MNASQHPLIQILVCAIPYHPVIIISAETDADRLNLFIQFFALKPFGALKWFLSAIEQY